MNVINENTHFSMKTWMTYKLLQSKLARKLCPQHLSSILYGSKELQLTWTINRVTSHILLLHYYTF